MLMMSGISLAYGTRTVFITLDYIGFSAPEESDPNETLHSKRKMDTEDDDDNDVL